MNRFVFGASLIACLITVAHAGEDSSAEAKAWLQRMSTSLATRNYDARFVHLIGGRAENMRILHRVDNGAVTERLVSLDGSGREVIRTESEVACYLPDRRTVLVEKRGDDASLWRALPTYSDGLQVNYELASVGATRILDRPVQLIVVKPRDQFRYGYRLWLDRDTAIPLKSQLCDHDGQVIEQVVLSSLSTPDLLDASLMRPAISTDGFVWVRPRIFAPSAPSAGSQSPVLAASEWRVAQAPQGFRITVTRMQTIQGNAAAVRHLVLSDGLASVSVFIEPRRASGVNPPGQLPAFEAGQIPGAQKPDSTMVRAEGELARIGTALAYSVQSHDHRITAVGEVPATTLRAIANGVQRSTPSEPSAVAITPRLFK